MTSTTGFSELDDLVLRLEGLVLARSLRIRRGADPEELRMFSDEIDRTRNRLARLAMSDGRLAVG